METYDKYLENRTKELEEKYYKMCYFVGALQGMIDSLQYTSLHQPSFFESLIERSKKENLEKCYAEYLASKEAEND